MSSIVAPKLKYTEAILKEKGFPNDNDKEELTLAKQIKNIKLNKYSRYFGNDIQNIEMAVLKIKENKKSLIIPRNKNSLKSRNDNTSQKSNDNNEIDDNFISKKHELMMDINTLKIQPFNKKLKSESLENQKIQKLVTDNILDIITEREISLVESNRGITANTSNLKQKSNLNLKELNLNLRECESYIKENPQYCVEYFPEIYKNFKLEEKGMKKIKDYIKYQPDLNEKMRAILVDWVIDVHHKFKLQTETLFLAIYLIDVYLSYKTIKRDQLQLIAISSLLIASKYEEIYSPDIRDFEYITEQGYTKSEILQMEYQILKILQFNITFPSTFRFYEIISAFLNFNLREFLFGRFLLELFIVDYRSTKYENSSIASAVCFLIMSKFFIKDNNRNKDIYSMKEFIENNFEDNLNLRECCKDISFTYENIHNTQLNSVKNKFNKSEFNF